MSPTVVIVEDDPGIRALLRTMFEIRGHTLHEAERGDEAVEAVRAASPDIVLLDIGLPGIDGLEVLRQLKDDEALRDIPVIMVTAWDDAPRVERARELGAVDYINKPFDALALVDRVEEVVGEAA
jgi:CheY-like chemotaxis protein